MDVPLSMEEVLNQIKQLDDSGMSLSKKKVKQTNPELMQCALYYFPSWEHAVQSSINIKE
ncbi:hypothetical protein ACFO25_16725 [Paenactinomyces guangxiensis]|uniref:Uncharacterized protein n=1 Tax=Paenactinomyces guangxiensis TaxID=1490290 RepID=A0A7W1WU25_9BACL|nr:hypothetical protein [Paenactinomyces guangxiensis]MBA4496042.1 hypothetical protein [Paenactinomyces guangxiensis]MBH8593130.1 hypothetical protein [Paenactinomyces guangxiensis]